MRYRIGASPAHPDIPATTHMVLLTASLSLLIGMALYVLARRGRQRWLMFWGGSLVVASAAYLAAVALGFA